MANRVENGVILFLDRTGSARSTTGEGVFLLVLALVLVLPVLPTTALAQTDPLALPSTPRGEVLEWSFPNPETWDAARIALQMADPQRG